jgi:mannose-6-phosphate isomerase-like protein (cupin superfamily)
MWSPEVTIFGHTQHMSQPADPVDPSPDPDPAFDGEIRPWGCFFILEDGPTCKVKRIVVEPGERLSYQLHHRRSEHWTFVAGIALVTLNGEDITLEPGSSIDIPRGADHRVRNPGSEPLEFIEVQMGDYFGEDDIVRLEDDYGRAGQ